ncbi:Predicted PurR-regulated permease PerM [Agromyces sp. CF514]|uniref:AI-2E family transporter n=1 Tax=Agromyces sp. CF514 TaxID=1881031 RepID=UPI0008E76A3B|nr:AI-2E family transporter [Agromyces sp. CF514]SFR70548.1 Predicted PurR-regulated permease PerM [Agromyces sp. CF514]
MWWNRKNPKPAPEAAPTADAVPSTVNRNALLLAGLGGGVLAVFGLAAVSSIVAPVFLALVLTICANPVRTALERRRVPTGIATGIAIVTVLALIVVFGYAVAVAFSQFASLLPQFAPQIQAAVASLGEALAKIGIGSDQISAAIGSFDAGSIVSVIWGLIGGLAGATTTFVIIFTMVLLMAMDAALLPGVLRQIEPHRALLVHSLRDYARNVRRYMVVTTALGVAQGLINWFVLVLLGVPGAFIWGLLSFICSFIPNVGYFIAIIPPIIFGALTGGWPTVIAVIVLYGIVNAGVQSIVQPRVVGNAVALSQSITFFSVLFWAIVLGPTGAILAIPLTLLVRMLLVDTNPRMPWIKPLLGDNTASKLAKAEAKAAAKAGTTGTPSSGDAAAAGDAADAAADGPDAPAAPAIG